MSNIAGQKQVRIIDFDILRNVLQKDLSYPTRQKSVKAWKIDAGRGSSFIRKRDQIMIQEACDNKK